MELYIRLTLILGLVAEILCAKPKFPHHSSKYVIRVPGSEKGKTPEGTFLPELTVKASNYYGEYCFKTFELRSDKKCVGRTVTIHMTEDGEGNPVDTCSTEVAAMVRAPCGVSDVTDAWDPVIEYNRENNMLTYHLEGENCLKASFKYDPNTKSAKENVISEAEKCPKEPSSALDGAPEKDDSSSSSSSSSSSESKTKKSGKPGHTTTGVSGSKTNPQKSTPTGAKRKINRDANGKPTPAQPVDDQKVAGCCQNDGKKKGESKANPTRAAQPVANSKKDGDKKTESKAKPTPAPPAANPKKDGNKKIESEANPTQSAAVNTRFSADDQFQ